MNDYDMQAWQRALDNAHYEMNEIKKTLDANSKLNAAAPDLLEALVMIRSWDDYNYQKKLDMIPIKIRLFLEEAIRKATGEKHE